VPGVSQFTCTCTAWQHQSQRGKKAREERRGERKEGASGQMERDESGSERPEERERAERAVLHPLQGGETHRMPHLYGSFVSTAPYN